MPVPTYDALMLPVLRHGAERTWVMHDLIDQFGKELGLSEAERTELLPGGSTSVLASRVHWAKTYLKQAGLVEQPKRGVMRATAEGLKFLATKPTHISSQMLIEYPTFVAFIGKSRTGGTGQSASLSVVSEHASATPEEQIASASIMLDEALRDTLLTRVLEGSPAFFERMILDLLLEMGYGGSRADAGEHLGGTGDGGVDGVIREDQLGLDRIYLQAKRYAPGNAVSGATVQAFIGALVGQGAQKGVLITTSSFSAMAKTAASQSGNLRIVLIDGEELTKLMVRFNVGVRVADTIAIKRVDAEYFEESDAE